MSKEQLQDLIAAVTAGAAAGRHGERHKAQNKRAVNMSKEQLQDLIAAVTAGAAAAAGAAGGAGGVAGTISAASLAGPMWAGTLEARENHLKEELEEVRRLRQVGNRLLNI